MNWLNNVPTISGGTYLRMRQRKYMIRNIGEDCRPTPSEVHDGVCADILDEVLDEWVVSNVADYIQ